MDFLDAAFHVEIAFRNIVVFAFQNLFEAPHRISHRHLLAISAGEHRRHREWLAQEALDFSRAEHSELVIR